MKRGLLLSAAILAGTFIGASGASANTISVALGTTANVVSTSSGTAGVIGNTSVSGWSVSASGTGSPIIPMPNLDSSTISANTSTGGTIKIYVTETGVTSPGAVLTTFISGFTVNSLTSGWSVLEQVFLDASNAAFGMATTVDSANFAAANPAGITTSDSILPGGVPYSITEVFTINATSAGSAVAGITLTGAVPEPASLSLLGFGLLGVAGLVRRRRSAV